MLRGPGGSGDTIGANRRFSVFRRLAPFVLVLPLALGALEMLAATGAQPGGSPSASVRAVGAGTAARSWSCRRPASSTRHGRLPRGRDRAGGSRRRGRRRHQAEHAGRQPRRDPAHRLDAPRGAAADDRVGLAVGRPRRERRHVHHARRTRRADGAGHEHRRGVAGRRRAARTSRETLGEKVLNDAIAIIRSIAETRGRNAEWAESTVRDATSSTATEALEVGAIDGIAGTIDEVLALRRRPDGDRERAAGDARPGRRRRSRSWR